MWDLVLHEQAELKVYSYEQEESSRAEELTDFNFFYLVYYRDDLLSMALFLKLHSLLRVTNAVDATVVDYIHYPLRFNLLYILQSHLTNSRYILST
jgi:hypothetical protein